MAFTKQPQDILDYDILMNDWFSDIETDGIEGITSVITSPTETVPTLQIGPETQPTFVLHGSPAHSFTMWVGGGTANVQYKVSLVVNTAEKRTKEVEVTFKVRDK